MNAFQRTTSMLRTLLPFLILVVGTTPRTITAQEEEDLAFVHRLLLDGEAVVERAGEGVARATLGERLQSGNLVATSPNTRAAIRFTDDGSLVRMNPNSRLQVTSEGDRGALAKTLELEFGELWARVTDQGEGSFQVQTPSGVAAVVGTELVVRVDEDGTTTVLTLEGAVNFFNEGGTVEIPAGSRAVATSEDAAAEVGGIEDEEREALEGLIEDEADEDVVRVEVPLQNARGMVRTLILELPRDEAGGLVDPGGNR